MGPSPIGCSSGSWPDSVPAAESVQALLDGHWYDALAALCLEYLPRRNHHPDLVRAQHLAVAAKRVLDLDAEDFGTIAEEFRSDWAKDLAAAAFPPGPRDAERGALGSLTALYRLMLEVLDLRARRDEPLQVVVTAHLIGEYLPMLAWQSRLGHAGDPARMKASVGERWGTDSVECPHTSSQRATARRAMHASDGDRSGYTAYLDRFHSRLGDALAVCAMNHDTVGAGSRPDVGTTCPTPCRWAIEGPLEGRLDLDARVRLAMLYRDSPIVALRHHAPVGHFFGVPSTREISEAWLRTWDRLSGPWSDGSNPLTNGAVRGAPEPDEALPGMSALISAVAGTTIGPGRLIRRIGSAIEGAFGDYSDAGTSTR